MKLNKRYIGVNGKLAFDVGYYDGNDKSAQAYKSWYKMLMRCYCEKYLAKRPTYKGVTVCKEWLIFSNFKLWHDSNSVDGWQLDKDLLSDSHQYNEESCLFVPPWLNTFMVDCGSSRGDSPIGVCFVKSRGMYQAQCRDNISGSRGFIGRFKTKTEAHRAWVDRKTELAFMLKDNMDAIDKRIYYRVINKIFNSLR